MEQDSSLEIVRNHTYQLGELKENDGKIEKIQNSNAGLIKNQSIELNKIEEEQDEIMNNLRSYVPRNFSKSVLGMELGKDSSVKITFKANPKPIKSIISCDNLHPLNSYEIHDGDSDEEYVAYLNFTMDQQILLGHWTQNVII